jgi:hypothetical protein
MDWDELMVLVEHQVEVYGLILVEWTWQMDKVLVFCMRVLE